MNYYDSRLLLGLLMILSGGFRGDNLVHGLGHPASCEVFPLVGVALEGFPVFIRLKGTLHLAWGAVPASTVGTRRALMHEVRIVVGCVPEGVWWVTSEGMGWVSTEGVGWVTIVEMRRRWEYKRLLLS